MAALKHDAQGFLVGDPIDIGRALAVWDDIRSDVRAIRKAVMGASEAAVKGGGKHADASRVITPRGGMEEADPAVKATPRGRERAASAIPARRYSDEIPSLLRKAVTPVRGQGNEVASTSAKPGASGVMVRPERKSPQSVAKPAGRDGRGRFTKGDGRPDGLLPNDAADDADTGALRSIADRIVGAVADSSGGMEEADQKQCFARVRSLNCTVYWTLAYLIRRHGYDPCRRSKWTRSLSATTASKHLSSCVASCSDA